MSMEAGSIKAIDQGSVHRICSGQVVLTLATAVKELVENSIDAGATIVDVKLKEYGSEMIEVSDNGSGVEENNFEGLTLKHYTSKLEDFSDLINVETFGFRGEALSSLCALSDLCVVTRHKDVQVGNKLEFDHQGRITCKTSIARQTGTTVTLQNLFYTLPVRHKEFQRNLKKEFVKMVQVLNAYCLINTGVRITCTNQTGKGSRTTVVSSKGNPTIKENISNIFGPKQLQSLKEFCQCKPTEEVSLEYGLKSLDSQTELFKIEGYISKCEHGQGRSSADRQFYFINKRPCDHSKLSKLVNEVYHQYNRHQYPFVVISITMCRESVDVNVTPDKRQIFIENEKILLAVIKTSLIQMYEVTTGVYTDNTIATQNQWNCLKKSPLKLSQDSDCNPEESPVLCKPSITSRLNSLKRSFRSTFSKSDEDSPVVEHNKQRRIDTFVIKSKSLISPEKEKDQTFKQVHQHECMELSLSTIPIIFETQETIAHKQETNCESQNSLILVHEQREIIPTDSESGISSSQELTGSQSSECFTVSSKTDSQHQSQESEEDHSNTLEEVKNECLTPLLDSKTIKSNNIYCELRNEVRESFLQDRNLCSVPTTCVLQDRNLCSVPTACVLQDRNLCSVPTTCVQLRSKLNDTYCNQNENDEITEVIITGSPIKAEPKSLLQITLVDEKQDNSRAERTVKFSFQAFRDKVNRRNTYKKTGESFCRTFRAKISPTDNKAAEEELQKEVKKETFSQMDILGQFNLGFIITKFRDDLFIVDQHATDEKYNFEMLQRHTVIQSQRLIHPQSLELTSSNEIILMDNIEVFRKNGFDFLIDEQGDPTQRVKLISTPVSKNWTFGKDDIEELIFMLTDSPGTMCRPSRVRQMFASRACRKSVMIGTALNKTEMKKLVDHMGQIDQPWNCPHGRPTMRHLINLNMIPK